MTDWLVANLRQRAAYDALCEVDRAASADACPLCGATECGSAVCETKRRKAAQQAQMQHQAALAGVVGEARC